MTGAVLPPTPGPEEPVEAPERVPADRRRWNARLPGRDEVELRQRWDKIAADLQSRGVLVVRLGFTPWTPSEADPSASVFGVWNPKTDERFPLTELSPLTAALAEAWASDLHVLAFVAEEGRIAPEQVLAELEPALLPEQE